MDLARYTFRVGHTSSRPLCPDEHVSFVTIAGEDTAAGRRDAELAACQMVGCRTEMVTSSVLVACTL